MSIFNPQVVDTLGQLPQWLEKHFSHMKDIVRAIEDTEQSEHFDRKRDTVTLDATGGGAITFEVRPGYDWSMERVTVTSSGNGMCQVYLDSVSPVNTVEIIGSSQIYSDGFANNIWVAQGQKVIFNFTNAGANGTATVNLQIKRLKRVEHVTRQLKAYDE